MNSPRKPTICLQNKKNWQDYCKPLQVDRPREQHTWKDTTATEARDVYIIDNAFFRRRRPE